MIVRIKKSVFVWVVLYYGKTLPSGNKAFSSRKTIKGKSMFLEYVSLVMLIVAMTAGFYFLSVFCCVSGRRPGQCRISLHGGIKSRIKEWIQSYSAETSDFALTALFSQYPIQKADQNSNN